MMANWTQADIDLRNLRVFGRLDPAQPASDAQEKPAEDRPEREIALECEQILREDGWRTLRCEPTVDCSRGRGFGETGMPDLLAIRYSRHPTAEVAWFEWKRPGGRLKKHQLAWHLRERARGALTAIAGVDFPASVQGFKTWYASSGLERRKASW